MRLIRGTAICPRARHFILCIELRLHTYTGSLELSLLAYEISNQTLFASSYLPHMIFSGKPTLDMSGVKDITVRAGQDIRINVPYKGVPQPTAKWSNGENIIEESSRTTLKVRYDP